MQRGKDILFRRLINMSKKHLEKNYSTYFLLSLFIVAGIIIGSILVLKINEKFKFMSYFNYLLNYIGNQDYTPIDISKSSVIFNMRGLLIIWVVGFVSLGIIFTPLITCIKGVSIGLTVGFFVRRFGIKGFLFSVLGLLPSYLGLVPIFLIMGTISILKSISYTNSKKRNYRNIALSDYGIILLLFFLLALFIILLEGFFISILFKLMGV